MIRALIFDFDGLIVDTETPDLLAWQEVYRQHGAELTLDVWAQVIGQGFTEEFEAVAYLEAQIGRKLDGAAIQRQHDEVEARLIAKEPVRPGVMNYLDDSRRRGLKLAVASSSDHAWVDGHLTRLGMFERFHAIRCSDDVARTKPAPDLFEAALDALGVEPHEAVVFEDSPNGAMAARAAGIYCVVVPNELTRQLQLDHADRLLDSLADLSLERLLSELDGR